jgi:hypothetical protein
MSSPTQRALQIIGPKNGSLHRGPDTGIADRRDVCGEPQRRKRGGGDAISCLVHPRQTGRLGTGRALLL